METALLGEGDRRDWCISASDDFGLDYFAQPRKIESPNNLTFSAYPKCRDAPAGRLYKT